jgi:transcriptional regulator with XRE-family HTH domain
MAREKKVYALPRHYRVVGEYLKENRIKVNLTQREVGQALGYSSSQFVSNFEAGIALPPLKTLRVLVDLYKMNSQTLMNLILEAEGRLLVHLLSDAPKKGNGGGKDVVPLHKARKIAGKSSVGFRVLAK